MTRTTYRIDPETKKLMPVRDWLDKYGPDETRGPSIQIMKDIDPFVSPIDKTVISSRPHLEAHNRKHGVTNIADYGDSHFKNKSVEMRNQTLGRTQTDRQNRREVIATELHKRGM